MESLTAEFKFRILAQILLKIPVKLDGNIKSFELEVVQASHIRFKSAY
jgi:hypothetical protein